MIDAAHDAASAEALLTATNAFLRSDDVEGLAVALVAAARTMFEPSKAAAIFREADGRRRVLATLGDAPVPTSPGPAPAQHERGRQGADVLERVLRGEELCTDDPASDDFAAQVAAYGAGAGLALPVATASDRPGVLIVLHDSPTPFDPGTRRLARSLCAQAGLAVELLETRRGLEAARAQLEETVAERTAELTDAVEQLTIASQARTEFLSNVSHELRTPLTSILGFTDLLLHGLEGPLTPSQHEDLRTIEASGGRLLALIDDLIDVSNLEAGNIELRPVRVDVAALLDDVASDLRPRAIQKGLSVSVSAGDVPAHIVADRVRLGTILGNLVNNAVKFTPRGGSIRVEASRPRDGWVRIDVVDTGIGIPPEIQPRVFERFFRRAGPDISGTGLGLSIARDYARLHGGDVTVDSRPGGGSRFTLCMPVEPPVPADTEP